MSLLRSRIRLAFIFLAAVSLGVAQARADDSFSEVANQTNKKVVKIFGAGGFQGLAAYGTGVLVSPQGHILTVASHLLQTENLRVHLSDGRRFEKVKVLVEEPALDAALLKIDNVDDLPFFDVSQAAQAPLLQPGDSILAFSNEFEIATRDEPVSVQHGVIAAYLKLHLHKGVHEAPYAGEVYVVDAITNNPGAGGGALTTTRGQLLGIIGKELRNDLTETWINYGVPIQVLAKFVSEAREGKYKTVEKKEPLAGPGGYHGIILVPKVVERTPPFVEEVLPGSPASSAGLKPDDLIVYIDGEQVPSVDAFREIMNRARPGTGLTLEVRRFDKQFGTGDKLISLKMTVAEPLAAAPVKNP